MGEYKLGSGFVRAIDEMLADMETVRLRAVVLRASIEQWLDLKVEDSVKEDIDNRPF